MNDSIIYDFETLSQTPEDAPVISVAVLAFSLDKAERGEYEYTSLVKSAQYMKFNVEHQVKVLGRKIDTETLQWWKEQGPEAIKELKPSSADVNITEMQPLIKKIVMENNIKYVFTRNNTFDHVIFHTVCRRAGLSIPYKWWTIRDTKSFIMGLTYGHDIKDNFIPPGVDGLYVKHDPRHDISLDIMRIQTILSAIGD